MTLDGFSNQIIDVGETTVFVRAAGSGPPVLMLHGFPETHLMWRDIAPRLAREFTVVCADLRGYGWSGCPASDADHAPYSKRAMGSDMIVAMDRLGHQRFRLAGHDRGGRVAYRMALDHPRAIEKIAVLDVLPTSTSWDRADARLALAFWPWSLLAQPEPLPERMLAADPEAVVDNALKEWGSPANAFPPEVRAAYIDALRDPEHIHAICEEYRAAATIDRQHDAADQEAGGRINFPLLALWSAKGGLENWYTDEEGPLGLWRMWSTDASGRPMDGGHFFPEEKPEETTQELRRFFS